uniref:Presenilin n=1 Tax=Anthurium amnicola TaxID=1678845 RepID=A0A1D1YLA9_9ARAE
MASSTSAPAPPPSILDTLGEEIVRIVAPVSACMLLVVLLVAALAPPQGSHSPLSPTIATMAYAEPPSSASSSWLDDLLGALLNSLAFVALLTALTFLLLLLFYLRCTAFLRYYMAFSSFLVLAFMGGDVSALLLRRFDVPLDCATFLLLLFNFAAVGTVAVLPSKGAAPILLTQGYLVAIGVLVAYWFTLLPEWTTWALLVAMAVYDLAAVLLPVGPLRLLVELAISRDEEIPALVYEARPVVEHRGGAVLAPPRRRLWRERRDSGDHNHNPNSTNACFLDSSGSGVSQLPQEEATVITVEEGRAVGSSASPLVTPLLEQQLERRSEEDVEGIGLGSSGAIKLGLGDFIFYSVLVGRAAMYDFMAVYACYLAIIAGLGVTLLLLAVYRKALPALPVSVALGVVFYFLTRMLLEAFVVQCSLNLVMF